MRDIQTMMWKEWRDLFFDGGGFKALWRPAIMLGVSGVYLPLVAGRDWLALPVLSLFVLLWTPFYLVISLVSDSFAGERERHTLETLLATRIPDRAILFGKGAVVIAFGTGMLLASLTLGLVVANLAPGGNGWSFYPVPLLFLALAVSVALNVMGACAGILVSLRAPTVRQVQQTMALGTILASVGIGIALRYLPGGLLGLPPTEILLSAFALLAGVDGVLVGAAMARFQRRKLILS